MRTITGRGLPSALGFSAGPPTTVSSRAVTPAGCAHARGAAVQPRTAAPLAWAQPAGVTALELTVVGGPALNPNAEGNPRPVIVRIYDLGAAATFESADYQALFEGPSAAVKRDVIAMEEIV